MPGTNGTKCAVPWCDRTCTTVVCSFCQERIRRIKNELGGVKFNERPKAFELLWDKGRNQFTIREASTISRIPRASISAWCRSGRIGKAVNGAKNRGSLYRYLLNRREVIKLVQMKKELDELERTHVPLTKAVALTGLTQQTLTAYAKHLPVVRPAIDRRLVFLSQETIELIRRERAITSLAATARTLGVRRSTVQDAAEAGRIRLVETTTRRFKEGVEQAEIERIRRTYITNEAGYRTIPKAAKLLRRDDDTIRRWLKELQCPMHRSLGGWTLIDRATLAALRERNAREKNLIGWREGAGLLGVHEATLAETAARHNLRTLRPSGRWALDPEDLEEIAEILGVERPNSRVLAKGR